MTGTLETVVRRIVDDSEFRAEAMAGVETAVAGYDLTAAEQIAVAELCEQLGKHGGEVVNAAAPMNFWF